MDTKPLVSGLNLVCEFITHAADGLEVTGFAGIQFKILSEIQNKIIDGPTGSIFIFVPQFFDDFITRNDFINVPR